MKLTIRGTRLNLGRTEGIVALLSSQKRSGKPRKVLGVLSVLAALVVERALSSIAAPLLTPSVLSVPQDPQPLPARRQPLQHGRRRLTAASRTDTV